ncbi:HRAS-like suppressor 2 [Biomphalaria glabrata]|uniref:Phospholipase A and acyltransferase 2-like isoform X1 n=2 Tax=Biomphalaria glabrata TaxID=6526 RepID=A0A9W2YVM5_BIOGL|nr:phospholipase A and acyltransferase 2-like isoform X1 [Biomphalaria glabrata]KAI8745954.1 HRAS-like suppressor 2 [Biomphalaria glabrata]
MQFFCSTLTKGLLQNSSPCLLKDKKAIKFNKGDLIKINRNFFWHWGVYNGSGCIIHVNNVNMEDGMCNAEVVCEPFNDVVGDCYYEKGNKKDSKWTPLDPEEIVKRAYESCKPFKYNVLFNNCEHFARWCRYDVDYSNQGNFLKTVLQDKLVTTLARDDIAELTNEQKEKLKDVINSKMLLGRRIQDASSSQEQSI